MKKSMGTRVISLVLIGMLIIAQAGCNTSSNDNEISSNGKGNPSETEITITDYDESHSSSFEEIETDYASFINFPSSGGTYDYYSYGYHYSTVTVSDFTYIVSEYFETEIRIDFEFVCTFDYLGERAGGSSFSFYINMYNTAGEKVGESFVNETNMKVGETGTTAHTILVNKDVVVQGITIKFESNS